MKQFSFNSGDWKCHVADTDLDEDYKHEKIISVTVATHAEVEISTDEDLTNLDINESVIIECVISEEGNPPANITLYHEQHGEEKIEVGVTSEGVISYEYQPNLMDTGSFFTCEWSQESHDGELLFEGKKFTDQIDVVMAPVFLDDDAEDHFVFSEEGLTLRIQFKAKPWPQEEDISWMLLHEADSEPVKIEHETEEGHFLIETLHETGEDEFEIESVLNVYDLTENVTIIAKISNPLGSISKSFYISLPVTTTTTTTTTEETSPVEIIVIPVPQEKADDEEYQMQNINWVAIVIACLFAVILVILGFVCFNQKSSRPRSNVRRYDDGINNQSIMKKKPVNGSSSGYYSVDTGSTTKSDFSYFTPDNNPSAFSSETVVMRQNSGRRFRTTEMTTFGKEKKALLDSSPANNDIEDSVRNYLDSVHYESSPITIPTQSKAPPGI